MLYGKSQLTNERLTEKSAGGKRIALVSTFLIVNAFTWYFLAAKILEGIVNQVATNNNESIVIWSLHFGAIAATTFLGTLLVKRIGRRTLFLVWTVLGVLSPVGLLTLDFSQTAGALLTSFLFGASLGVGMPNCMECFKRLTNPENRGRYGGLVMLFSGLGLFAFGLAGIKSMELSASVLVIWRIPGLLFLILPDIEGKQLQTKRDVSYKSVVGQRSFLLYLVPWIMFSLTTYLTTPIQFGIVGQSTVELLIIVENVIIGVSALVGGFLCDTLGRKRMAITGFALLGLGYSVLGIYPQAFSMYFYTVVDGIAWGNLFVVFVVTVWGDLSLSSPSDKHYAVGVLPFFISKFLQLTVGRDIATLIPTYAIFSFTAFFLFLAVLPLVYAPETLPEKVMKERELKMYVEKAQEIAQKYY